MMREGAYKHLEMMPGACWGLGVLVLIEPEKNEYEVFPGTFSWSGAYGAHFFVDPVRKLQAVLMINRDNIGGAASPISRKLEKQIFEKFA